MARGTDPTRTALVVGEALIDIVRGPGGESRLVGGGPLNVAIGLQRLGVDTELLTALGRDADAEMIRARLETEGVSLSRYSTRTERSSAAVVTIGPDGAPTYSFDVTWALARVREVPRADVVHVGSVAAFMAPGADEVMRIARLASRAGSLVTVDPNVRPAVLDAPAVAIRRFEELAAIADVVKLSDEDGAYLYPGAGPMHVVDRLLALGPRLVALTRGSEGAILATDTEVVSARADVVDVVDTVGAGDAYMAALVQALLGPSSGKVVPDLAWLAERCARAAAVAVARRGADPATLADLDASPRHRPAPAGRTGGPRRVG